MILIPWMFIENGPCEFACGTCLYCRRYQQSLDESENTADESR